MTFLAELLNKGSCHGWADLSVPHLSFPCKCRDNVPVSSVNTWPAEAVVNKYSWSIVCHRHRFNVLRIAHRHNDCQHMPVNEPTGSACQLDLIMWIDRDWLHNRACLLFVCVSCTVPAPWARIISWAWLVSWLHVWLLRSAQWWGNLIGRNW